jgi:hypothetical protein
MQMEEISAVIIVFILVFNSQSQEMSAQSRFFNNYTSLRLQLELAVVGTGDER